MTWLRKNPWFATVLILCGLIVIGEGWCIYERSTTARALEKKLKEKHAQLLDMGVKVPAPTRETAAAIEADLARARRSLVAMQAELRGRGPVAERLRTAKVPTTRTDTFFDLASWVEKTRELAKKAEMDIRPDAARLGFSAHANEAPELERIEAVFRQRQLVQYLVDALIESKPRALVAVKRERPMTRKERDEKNATAQAAAAAAASGNPAEPVPEPSYADDSPDFFALDPRVSVRAPGFLDSIGFKITFIGETGSLRSLLNRLAAFELPVLVREVEVEPVTPEEAAIVTGGPEATTADASAPAAASVVLKVGAGAPEKKPVAKAVSTAAPIVAKPYSRFTVTVEFVELTPPATPQSDNPATPPAT